MGLELTTYRLSATNCATSNKVEQGDSLYSSLPKSHQCLKEVKYAVYRYRRNVMMTLDLVGKRCEHDLFTFIE